MYQEDNHHTYHHFLDESSVEQYLDLESGGCRSYVFPATEHTRCWAKQIRELHKLRLANAGYRGYSDEIDKEYHVVGIYFCIVRDGIIVLTSRVNDRTHSRRFPFEMGITPGGNQYHFDENIVAIDINTYSLIPKHRKRAMPLLLASLGKYADSFNAQKAFCLVDQENTVVQISNNRFVRTLPFTRLQPTSLNRWLPHAKLAGSDHYS